MPIAKCTCKNSWQDEHYGPGMRVHNLRQSKDKDATGKAGRCTVCGKERAI